MTQQQRDARRPTGLTLHRRPGSTEKASGAADRPAVKLAAAILLSASGFVLFGLQLSVLGYSMLAASLILAAFANWALFRDLALIAFGITVMSVVPITTDISMSHMLIMGTAMALAVAGPYLISRYGYRDHAIRFPIRTGQPWTRLEKWYLPAVVVIGYLLLPFYMINTGVYENWPAVSEADGVARLFLGTNVLGIWDELFFICTAFALFRRHFPDWLANVLQAVLFTSFLYELGFHAWGPVFIYLFALVQGYIFKMTKSLSYIVCVHLLFDFVLFLVLIHAHNRAWLDIFLY